MTLALQHVAGGYGNNPTPCGKIVIVSSPFLLLYLHSLISYVTTIIHISVLSIGLIYLLRTFTLSVILTKDMMIVLVLTVKGLDRLLG